MTSYLKIPETHLNPITLKTQRGLLRKNEQTSRPSTKNQFLTTTPKHHSKDRMLAKGVKTEKRKRHSETHDDFTRKCFEQAYMQQMHLQRIVKEKQKQFIGLKDYLIVLKDKKNKISMLTPRNTILPDEISSIDDENTNRLETFQSKRNHLIQLKEDLDKMNLSSY